MNKFIFLFLMVLLTVSCDEENQNVATRNVVSEDGSVPFQELILLLNIKASDSTYLVVKSIDSVNLYVNNRYWAKVNSDTLDTSKINKVVLGNTYVSSSKINYLVKARQDIEESEFTTAGEFAQFLNLSLVLKPGEYACFVESFQITFNDNTTKTYYPFLYEIFKVEKDVRSAYVGEIELKID